MKKIALFLSLTLGTMLVFTACKNDKPKTNESENSSEIESNTTNADLAGDVYTINAGSKLNWEGSKLGSKHHGTINISNGSVSIDNDKITGGSFVIDMTTITNLDQEGEWKEKLEKHLKGLDEGKEDHFFNVTQYPTAQFVITKVGDLEGNENANSMIYGDLTIKGITKPVGFTAQVELNEGSATFKSSPIVLNRTDWGVNYNSKSIFPNLAENIINDEITIQVEFAASK